MKKLTALLLMTLCAGIGQAETNPNFIPKIRKWEGYYKTYEANLTTWETSVNVTRCANGGMRYTSTWMMPWNNPTTNAPCLIPYRCKIIDQEYVYDQWLKSFYCYTNKQYEMECGRWVTNIQPIFPLRMVEPPLNLHGKVTTYLTNKLGQLLLRASEGSIVWKIDATRSTRPYWNLMSFRVSPISSLYPTERTFKFYTYVPAGGVKLWTPDWKCALGKLTNATYLIPVGATPIDNYPYDVENSCIEDGPELKE